MTVATPFAPNALDSAQRQPDGTPRFRIPAQPAHPEWAPAVQIETDRGMQAEVRVFLDEQVETGDVILDLAPGFGFVALGAATAPNGVASVFVADLPEAELVRLQDAAADAGAWVEPLETPTAESLAQLLDARLDPEGRILIHADAETLLAWCERIAQAGVTSRLLALCLSGTLSPAQWTDIVPLLDALGLAPCTLVERDGEGVLVPVTDAPSAPVIAVPRDLFEASDAEGMHDEAAAEGADELFGDTSAAWSTAPALAATSRAARERWVPLRDGLSLIAPHSRTGYGVTGANLLRALQARGVPVTLFPLGPVDHTLTHNPMLPAALERQAAFHPDAPSVRLSQQFDLALHAGRGPRVAFTIFETETFTPRELHHLRQQDLVITCSPWGQSVCVANGLTDVPVRVVPLGVDLSVFNDAVVPVRRWDETVFLQVGKLEPRKGQLELLRAFEAAFTPKDPVRLVLACHNPFVKRDAFEAALAPFRQSPMARRITLLPTELATAHDVAALMAAADCGVFAVRAEGWNLEALEMMAMGKRIIASRATAHTAYMTDENAALITLGAPESAAAGHMRGTWGSWGAAQHEQLVAALRAVHAERQEGGLAPNRAGITTAETLSWETSAAALLDAIATIA
jgi:glycosyltransferase involved in cell wall biosynthesis